MPKINEQKFLNYSAQEMYNLIIDVEKYPQFLPWCKNVQIVKEISANNIQAELLVSFKNIFEKYTSDVVYGKNSELEFFVNATAIKGPFKSLVNKWKISEVDHKKCQIDFFLEFEFNSFLLGKLIGPIFGSATEKMMKAFEKRAHDLYD